MGLAQAILSKPEILLLDEPTEGLDPNQRRDIQQLLGELRQGRTLIISSHVLGEITKIATRIIIISQGLVVGDDTPANLVKTTGKTQTVMVEIAGKGVKEGLQQLAGVNQVTAEAANVYLVTTKKKIDIRPEIFKLAVKQKWVLLTMRQVERQLEDVFSELTE